MKRSEAKGFLMYRIFKAKRSTQSNEEKPAPGRLVIAKGLFSSNVTEAAGKDGNEVKSQTIGTLFNFSNQATAGAAATGGQTLFGGTTGTLFGGQGLKSTA